MSNTLTWTTCPEPDKSLLWDFGEVYFAYLDRLNIEEHVHYFDPSGKIYREVRCPGGIAGPSEWAVALLP